MCLAYQSGSKTIDDIIDGLPETTNGKGVARNFESTGDFEQTIRDFDALNPIDVKEIQTKYGSGKVGKLSDGTTVVARPGSTTGGATLEIRVSNRKVYKIRYYTRDKRYGKMERSIWWYNSKSSLPSATNKW